MGRHVVSPASFVASSMLCDLIAISYSGRIHSAGTFFPFLLNNFSSGTAQNVQRGGSCRLICMRDPPSHVDADPYGL